MTQQLTNLQIDAALAKAIGYLPEHIKYNYLSMKGISKSFVSVFRPRSEVELNLCVQSQCFKNFSHQDPTVILPIIEHLKISVEALWDGHWYAEHISACCSGKDKNLCTAAALAAIEFNKEK